MSRTTVYAAFEDGEMVEIGKFGNSWLGAMHIWTALAKKYAPHAALHSEAGLRPVWALEHDPRLSDAEHYALVSTFDAALAGPEVAILIADALEAFPDATDNLKGQAEAIRGNVRRGARAIGWHQTSVTQNPWVAHDECPACHQTIEEGRPFVVGKDTETAYGKDAWWIERRTRPCDMCAGTGKDHDCSLYPNEPCEHCGGTGIDRPAEEYGAPTEKMNADGTWKEGA